MSFSASVSELVEKSESPLVRIADWWERIPLGEVSSVLNGFPWKSAHFNTELGVPVVRIRDVTSGQTETRYRGPIEEGFWIVDGDLLVGMDGDFNSRIWAGGRALLNQRVCRIQPNEDGYRKQFLAIVLPGYLKLINDETHSVTVKHLSSKTLAEIPLPLPPMPEQQRIVAKISSLSAKSQRARDHLDHIPRLVEKYKRAILLAAFRGNLTKQAKIDNHWPDWVFERAEEVCAKVQSGGTPKEGFLQKGIPFLKVYNLVNQKVSFEYKPQFVGRSVHEGPLSKSRALPGDVLMNIVGPPLGKVATIPGTYPEWNLNQALTLFRPSKKVSSKWIYYYLCSGKSVSEVIHETKGSAGQVNISLSQCRDFVFPVPSPDEQAEIIRRIEVAFAWIDRLAAEATGARKLVDNLDQAILAKAFRGELVAQDPHDEPTSKLLERIRAGRLTDAAKNSKATRRKKIA